MGQFLLVAGRVRETRLVTKQLASNRNSNRKFLNTVIAQTAEYVTNIIWQQSDKKIKGEFFLTLSLI
jgi:hypothetical protein